MGYTVDIYEKVCSEPVNLTDLWNEINKWLNSHCKGRYRMSAMWLTFEVEDDAVLFKLTWL